MLLLGVSGCGKSDLALRLIEGGAKLIADDRVSLMAENGILYADTPEGGAGLLEVRGVGVMRLPREQCCTHMPVSMAIMLGKTPERMPESMVMTWCGVDVPLYYMQAFEVSTVSKLRLIARSLDGESGVQLVT